MQILLIPGLGDRDWAYRLAQPLWRRHGHSVHVAAFGWRGGADDFAPRLERLVQQYDALAADGPVCAIGGSAGGLAAIALLAQRPQLSAVITVAAPLNWDGRNVPRGYQHRLQVVQAALSPATEFLAQADPATQHKITSFYGWDHLVRPRWSQPANIRAERLPMAVHGLIIGTALTVFAGRLQRAIEAAIN